MAGLADFVEGEEAGGAAGDAGVLVEGAQVADALAIGDGGAGRAD